MDSKTHRSMGLSEDYDDLPPLLDEEPAAGLTAGSVRQVQQSDDPEHSDQSDHEEHEMLDLRADKKQEIKEQLATKQQVDLETKKEEQKVFTSLTLLPLSVELEEEKDEVPNKFKVWDDISRDKIVALLATQEELPSKFEAFKFFLGPAFNPILKRYQHEVYEDLGERDFRISCKELFYGRVLSGVILYQSLNYVSQIVTIREKEIKDKAVDTEVRALFNEMKASYEAILKIVKEQGLEPFKAWVDKNKRTVGEFSNGVLLDVAPIPFSITNLPLTDEVKAELRPLLLGWAGSWMENRVQCSWNITGLSKDEVALKLRSYQEKWIDFLLSNDDLLALKQEIGDYSFPFQRTHRKKERACWKTVAEVKSSYKEFAHNFLSVKKNRLLVKRFFFPVYGNSYQGMSAEDLVEMIINYKLYLPYYKNTKWLNKIIALIAGIKDTAWRKQFEQELEQHCEVLLLQKAKETVVTVHKQIEASLAKKDKPEEQKELALDAESSSVTKSVNELMFETAVAEPLTENQLLLLLNSFTCISQKQIMLKQLLRYYLIGNFEETRPWLRSFFYKKISIERRRQVQYLAGSLFVAVRTGTDEGILSSVSDKKDESRVGANLVIDTIHKEQNSYSWLSKALLKLEKQTLESATSLQPKTSQPEAKSAASRPSVGDREPVSPPKKVFQAKTSPLVRFSLTQFPLCNRRGFVSNQAKPKAFFRA